MALENRNVVFNWTESVCIGWREAQLNAMLNCVLLGRFCMMESDVVEYPDRSMWEGDPIKAASTKDEVLNDPVRCAMSGRPVHWNAAEADVVGMLARHRFAKSSLPSLRNHGHVYRFSRTRFPRSRRTSMPSVICVGVSQRFPSYAAQKHDGLCRQRACPVAHPCAFFTVRMNRALTSSPVASL